MNFLSFLDASSHLSRITRSELLQPSALPKGFQLNTTRLQQLPTSARKALGRSLHIRHVDTGSSNAEEAELIALSAPQYDLSRFGLDFTASPRHADVLAVTGPVTRQLKLALDKTMAATAHPKLIVAIGDGACYGGVYEPTYACLGRVDQFVPVDVYLPGNPPTPTEILAGLIHCQHWLLS